MTYTEMSKRLHELRKEYISGIDLLNKDELDELKQAIYKIDYDIKQINKTVIAKEDNKFKRLCGCYKSKI